MNIKRTLQSLALLALTALPALAQNQTFSGITVNATVSSNLPVTLVAIDTSSQQNIAIKWTFNLNGAGTDVIGVRFIPSIDNTLPTTPTLAGGYYMTTAAAGTTPVTVQTNFNCAGYRYLIGYYITNNSAAQILTNRFDAYVKRNAP